MTAIPDLTMPARAIDPDQLFHMLEQDHVKQARLCDILEQWADRLPELPGRADLSMVAEALGEISNGQYRYAETLFLTLPAHLRPHPTILAQLSEMHAMDALHGDDLLNELRHGEGKRVRGDAERIGYMLRCYFDGCRRALALKQLLMASVCEKLG